MSKQGFFRSYEYVYDEYHDCVLCPNDQVLRYTNTNRDGYREFKSSPRICATCPSLYQCTESRNHQKVVTKHIWEPYIDAAEDYRHSPAGKESYGLRGQTIERVFADTKEKHGMRYTLHRGLDRVRLDQAKTRCHEPEKAGNVGLVRPFFLDQQCSFAERTLISFEKMKVL